MGHSFGEDFSDVQVRRGVPGALANLGVRALAGEGEIALDPGSLDGIDGAGREVLAHELAHVVQKRRGTVAPDAVDQRLGGGAATGPSARDTLEDDADRAAARAARGEAAPVAAGARAPEQQFSLWDSVRSAGNWVAGAASTAYGTASGALNSASGYVQRAEQGITSGVHRAEDWVSHGAHAVADRVADAVGVGGQVLGGVVGGASTMVGGIANAALHPVDTALGIEAMLEHSGPGAGTVLRAGHDLVNVARGRQTLSQTARRAVDPAATAEEDAGFWSQVGSHIAAPYRASAREHRYGEMLGRGIFDLGSLFMGGGEVSAARRGAAAAGDLGRVAEGTRAVGITAEAAHAAPAAGVADVMRAEIATADGTRAAGTSVETSQAAGRGRPQGRQPPPATSHPGRPGGSNSPVEGRYRENQRPLPNPNDPLSRFEIPDDLLGDATITPQPTSPYLPELDPLNPRQRP